VEPKVGRHRDRPQPTRRHVEVSVKQYSSEFAVCADCRALGAHESEIDFEPDPEDGEVASLAGSSAANQQLDEEVINICFDGSDDDDESYAHLNSRRDSLESLDADRLQIDNLLAASRSAVTSRIHSRVASRAVSRVASRVASRAASKRNSRQASRTGSRRGSFSDNGSVSNGAQPSETLGNILHLAEARRAALSYCYTDEDGSVVAHTVYDVSGTDPVEILGDDIFSDALEMERDHCAVSGGQRHADPLDPAAVHRQLTSGAVSADRFIRGSPSATRRALSVNNDQVESDQEIEWFPAGHRGSASSSSGSNH